MNVVVLPVKHGDRISTLVASGRRGHGIESLLLAVEGLIEAELVVAGDNDFVLVRLSAEPLVELTNFGLKTDPDQQNNWLLYAGKTHIKWSGLQLDYCRHLLN